MDIVYETLGFAAKGFVVFVTVAAIALVLFGFRRRRQLRGPRLLVRPLNKRFDALADALRSGVLAGDGWRKIAKDRKKTDAQKKKEAPTRPSVYVLDFDGDLLATEVKSLREEVTAITAVAGKEDEVVIRLESPGGAVPHYGLAAAQLQRLRDKAIKVTVCIDRIAASGGYMMACVADTIVAAPFSIIGSIGVVAQVPNFHRLLKKHEVDFQEMTAGEFKRTVSLLGEITEKGRKKFQDQLEDTHQLFKDYVKSQRPKLDVDKVSTGEYWLGRRGLELGLVDQLSTSDDYLVRRAADANLFQVSYESPMSLRDRITHLSAGVVDRTVLALLNRVWSLQLR